MLIVRTYSAGVFAVSDIEDRSSDGKRGTLRNARRLWYWAGAASLSELAAKGTSKPKECKFPVAVDGIEVMEIIELLPVTAKAEKSINSVPIWTA
jgi:hypothetical protein